MALVFVKCYLLLLLLLLCMMMGMRIVGADVHIECQDAQKNLLLQLRNELRFDPEYSKNLVQWNLTRDCCGWAGVECDDAGAGHVTALRLNDESISGGIDDHSTSSLFRLTFLETLDLSSNLHLFNNTHIPRGIFTLTSLMHLDLSGSGFVGPFPSSLPNLTHLLYLDLSYNFFSSSLSHFHFPNNITFLALHDNMLSGTIPTSLFSLPSLQYLSLSFNNFSGLLTEFPILNISKRTQSSLLTLDLSNNQIAGDIPSWIWELGNATIQDLNLSSNMLEGLQKPYHTPSSLVTLDLHSNQLRGEFPKLPQLVTVPPHSFDGPTQPTVTDIAPLLLFISLANNSFTGAIPTSLCNAMTLQFLDLSFNNFTSHIPPCLLDGHFLKVLNLRGNNIHGVIPDTFYSSCILRTLDLSNNNLGGKIPKSLANCDSLAVLNLGHNKFDDSFPCMLPSSLRVLVLRSNRFHGELRCNESWPNLQILDMSSNNFSGTLHPLNLSSWRGMMKQGDGHLRLNHSTSDYLSPYNNYRDEVTLTVKGVEVKLVKIWPDFTSIDLSCNNFHGDIPDAIGNLTSLYVLNLSQNALTGTIPKSLASLTELGSLDLSENQLTGRIPEELARLTFLSILKLSYNQLVGVIPNGGQFQTFSADWFEGNLGLCGFPLNTSCSNTSSSPTKPKQEEEEEIEWEYVFGAAGYVVGLGSIVWMLIFSRSFREIYYDKIEEILERRRRGARRRAMMMRRRKRKEEVRRR